MPLMDKRTVSEIIDALGGTSAVAELCDIKPPSVSEWKDRNEIPKARLMYLQLVRPDVFGRPKKPHGTRRPRTPATAGA